jgi:hypothetical protein
MRKVILIMLLLLIVISGAILVWVTAEEATAIFTFELVIVGAVTALVLYFQFNLARNEFLAAHPPKLVVRRVYPLSNPTRIQYIVLNVGDTDATIIESDAIIRVELSESKLPFFPHYSGKRDVMGNPTIKRGAQIVLESRSDDLTDSWELIKDGSHRVIFIGWMTYQNAGGNRGYTAFGRIYDVQKDGFVVIAPIDGMPEYDKYEYTT